VARPASRTQPRTIPTQERSRETVDALLDATEEVARRVGFDEATTKEIAQRAGVSAGTLYRYFPSKEALLAAVVNRQWEAGLREFGEGVAVMQPGPFDATVRRIVELAFSMIASRIEALGKMRIETNNVLHLTADRIDGAVALVRGVLERRRSDLIVEDIEVASLVVVRTVVFLARIAARDYGELVRDGRFSAEVAAMISRYLTAETSDPGEAR